GDQDARPAPLGALELGARLAGAFDVGGRSGLVAVHTRDGTDLLGVPAEHLLQRVGDLAHGGLGAGRVHGQLEQVGVEAGGGVGGGVGERVQCPPDRVLVPLGPQPAQLVQLLGADGAV